MGADLFFRSAGVAGSLLGIAFGFFLITIGFFPGLWGLELGPPPAVVALFTLMGMISLGAGICVGSFVLFWGKER